MREVHRTLNFTAIAIIRLPIVMGDPAGLLDASDACAFCAKEGNLIVLAGDGLGRWLREAGQWR